MILTPLVFGMRELHIFAYMYYRFFSFGEHQKHTSNYFICLFITNMFTQLLRFDLYRYVFDLYRYVFNTHQYRLNTLESWNSWLLNHPQLVIKEVFLHLKSIDYTNLYDYHEIQLTVTIRKNVDLFHWQ